MLTPGTRLGPYDIKALIGHGGMGEVYRARDTTLDRDVAIKILPAGFATDPERLARFEREAKTLAALNHPNIAQIHGAEDTGSTRAIVMELVDGEDLSQRIARGPIALAQALPIARQIAEAMQTAHDHGIIHRDLKPANVKVRTDGTVKLLDFGLAKADAQPANTDLSHSPTAMASIPGTLLGTVAYMSPEQVKGQTANERSDVWAFGCLLFEMLTGRAAFGAATTSEILASVLTKEPDWQHLPPETPEPIRRLLRRCLQKNETARLHALADARLEIDEAQQPDRDGTPSRAPQSQAERFAWASVVAILGGLALALGWWAFRPTPEPAEVRFDIATLEVADPIFLSSFALSADGRRIAFVANSDGQSHVWVRNLDSVAARPLTGTGGAFSPFWSPDGRSIAFYADGFLKRLDLDGGLVRPLARSTLGVGGSWSRDGVILFVRNPAGAISRVSAEGGPSADVTRLDAGQVGHTNPHFLPDGRHFLFYVTAAPDSRGVHVGDVNDSSSRRLVDADAGGVHTNGHVLFIRQTQVFAQSFDAERLELKGSPFQIADGVFARGDHLQSLSASSAAFAFRAGAASFARQITWSDRKGNQLSTVGEPLAHIDGASWSPDRSQMVFFERGPTSSDLWLLDARRGVVSRVTEDPDEDIFPVWGRDGNRVIYTVVQKGQVAIYQRHIGSNRRELLIAPQAEEIFASDVSPDERYLVYQRMNAKTGWDIWAHPLRVPNTGAALGAPLASDAKPIPIVQTDADERLARISPDGRWIAFVANNSGRFEVYVQPFPGPGRSLQVSTKGGDQPQWRPDGSELFYLAMDGKLTAASIKVAADGQSIDIGPPVPLFVANVGSVMVPVLGANYAASADGQRFLMNRLVNDAGGTPLRVVLNWRAGQ